MGVSGTVGLVSKNMSNLAQSTRLHNMALILDTTGALYWYSKTRLLNGTNCDKYGCSMPELGKLYRNLLVRLREQGCRLHVVFDGPRKSERSNPMVSKIDHLTRSSLGALRRLSQGNLSQMDNLPDLAINCLKEVINELNLGPDQIHQAEGEVYPVLVRLSRLHQAPVLTAHSDFIFQDCPAGFVWLERLELPTTTKAIECDLLSHQRLLQLFGLNESHSESLGCLSVLFRDDFAEKYHGQVNRCLDLERAGSLRVNRNVRWARVKTRRLQHVLQNWPTDLTSKASLREKLIQSAGNQQREILENFEAIWECYFDYRSFSTSELADTIRQGHLLSVEQVEEALTKRESSVQFLENATLRNFNRTGIEDLDTFRSTFSLQDRVKQFLMDKLNIKSISVFDRQYASMQTRHLSHVNSPPASQLSCTTLYGMFQFDEAKLTRVSNRLRDGSQIDAIICNELALLLLLASFALGLIPRKDHDNQPDVSQAPRNSRYMIRETRLRFLVALLNGFVYLQSGTNQGDQSRQEVPAEVRVARQKVDEIVRQQPAGLMSMSDENYVTRKHLIESLNSVLHAYIELNSLYDYQGLRLPVNKYYDGVIVYKIMARYSNRLQEYLLKLDDSTLNELLP